MADIHINEDTRKIWRVKFGDIIDNMVDAAIQIADSKADEIWVKFGKANAIDLSSCTYDMQFRDDTKRFKNKTSKRIVTITLSVIQN